MVLKIDTERSKMKIITNPTPKYDDLSLCVFMCRDCGNVYMDATKDDVKFFADMGGNYYTLECRKCKKEIFVEVPLLDCERNFFTYVKELRIEKAIADEIT